MRSLLVITLLALSAFVSTAAEEACTLLRFRDDLYSLGADLSKQCSQKFNACIMEFSFSMARESS